MTNNLINRYVWLVDTLMRYGKLTRRQIDDLWMRSSIGDGQPIPQRTFFHYRRAIEENFHIDIKCNGCREYYIEQPVSRKQRALTNWMLNSLSTTSAIGDNADADRIMLEEVPSAREFFPQVLDAIRSSTVVSFTYAGFNRSRPEADIRFSPWFVRLYKQRWYMVGLRHRGNVVRTYALDRVTALSITSDHFTLPDNFDPEDIFRDLVGITSSQAPARTVRIRTDATQAKYLRALPLHSSQQEEVGDGFSIFTYKLKLNYELVHEILALGPQAQVLAPKELRAMVVDELKKTLNLYEPNQLDAAPIER